jgi:peptide/nickel transport system substrate-binding protein
MISRRSFVAATGAVALASPAIVRAQGAGVLKFIPQSDLTILDPVATTLYTTRNHAFIVYDTLFGMDSQYRIQPQMLSGFKVEEDGMRWLLTLRDGLMFHDGEKVLARDCVASILRWARRDALGGTLLAATGELSAPDDKTIQFRMKKRFPLLPFALGKVATPMCAMMPERLAKLDPFKPLPEITGSGPFRFVADEYVSGVRAVYQRFAGYQPRQEASAGWSAGGKVVHVDRVEWVTINDPSTAGNALVSGEVDWWEQPTDDLAPLLTRNDKVRMEITDRTAS